MSMTEKNLERLIKAIGNIELDASEKQTIEWLSSSPIDTVENICSILYKMKNRGAGRKKTVDVCAIRVFKAEGKTQEWIARQMDVSVSTIRRNWD